MGEMTVREKKNAQAETRGVLVQPTAGCTDQVKKQSPTCFLVFLESDLYPCLGALLFFSRFHFLFIHVKEMGFCFFEAHFLTLRVQHMQLSSWICGRCLLRGLGALGLTPPAGVHLALGGNLIYSAAPRT